jgi:hypothetical protein
MTVPTEDSSGHGALSLLIDLDSAETTPMEELSLASAGFKEREDLTTLCLLQGRT